MRDHLHRKLRTRLLNQGQQALAVTDIRRCDMHCQDHIRLVRRHVFLVSVDRLVALLDPATVMIRVRMRLLLRRMINRLLSYILRMAFLTSLGDYCTPPPFGEYGLPVRIASTIAPTVTDIPQARNCSLTVPCKPSQAPRVTKRVRKRLIVL